MWTSVKWEFALARRSVRNWGSLAALAVIGVLFAWAYGIIRQYPGVAQLVGARMGSAFYVPIFAVSLSANILLPLFVTLCAADAIAGERQTGTWDLFMAQGIPPLQQFLAKWIIAVGYAGLATVTLIGFSFLSGSIGFGIGATTLPSGVVASWHYQILCLLVMTAFCVAGQAVVATLALVISAWSSSGVTAMMISMGMVVSFVLLTSVPGIPGLDQAIFTTYFSRFTDILQSPPNWGGLGHGAFVYGLSMLGLWAFILWWQPFRH